MEEKEEENKGGDAKCTSNALWKRFKSRLQVPDPR